MDVPILNPLQEPREWHDLVNRFVRAGIDLPTAVNFRNKYRHSEMTPDEIFVEVVRITGAEPLDPSLDWWPGSAEPYEVVVDITKGAES